MRDAFYASPVFPRLLNPDTIKETISRGVNSGVLAYVGKTASGYEPFEYGSSLNASCVEISGDMFIITRETAEKYKKSLLSPAKPESGDQPVDKQDIPIQQISPAINKVEERPKTQAKRLVWSGEVPWQKWSTFYTRVLSKFAGGKGMKLTLKVEIEPDGGLPKQKIEETKSGLRELGLSDEVDIS